MIKILKQLLGASWSTSAIGCIVLVMAGVASYMGSKVEAASLFAIGVGFLRSRDANVSTEQQAAQPGLLSNEPQRTNKRTDAA